jgi:hypothetical protein
MALGNQQAPAGNLVLAEKTDHHQDFMAEAPMVKDPLGICDDAPGDPDSRNPLQIDTFIRDGGRHRGLDSKNQALFTDFPTKFFTIAGRPFKSAPFLRQSFSGETILVVADAGPEVDFLKPVFFLGVPCGAVGQHEGGGRKKTLHMRIFIYPHPSWMLSSMLAPGRGYRVWRPCPKPAPPMPQPIHRKAQPHGRTWR